jgi:hypothetical protein
MQTENKVSTNNNTDNSRNSVISIKVSNAEKALLQKMADDFELTLSEYIRLKGLANLSAIYNQEKEIEQKDEEIAKLKIALSFYEHDVEDVPGITIPLTSTEKRLLIDMFTNYYGDGQRVEYQILHYLIDDIFTVHYEMKKPNLVDSLIMPNNAVFCMKAELPVKNSSYSDELLAVFKKFGISEYKLLNQLKTNHNPNIKIELCKPSKK